MDPLDPGCCGCCLFFPMPKFLRRWVGGELPESTHHLTDPDDIKQWGDAVFDGRPTVLIRTSDFRVGLGTIHQLADERGYHYTGIADFGGEGWPMVYQFDLIGSPAN